MLTPLSTTFASTPLAKQGTKSYLIQIIAPVSVVRTVYIIYITCTHHRDSWEGHKMLYKFTFRVFMQNRYLVIVLGVRLLKRVLG